MEDFEVNIETMQAKISLAENMVYIVKDGILKQIDSPPYGHGKQTVTWANGKPINVENYFTRKI